MRIRDIFKTIAKPVVTNFHHWYHSKPRVYTYGGLQVNVLPEVYSPSSNSTTKVLLDFVDTLDLNHKTVLELGCGSGIVSLLADEKGALVTASDINDIALKELTVHNRDENRGIIVVYSDLFEMLSFHFDYILINPPYLSQKNKFPGTFCGSNFEYYDKLFKQLRIRGVRASEIYVVLPEEAEIFSICRRAKLNHLKLKTVAVTHQLIQDATVYRVVEDL